MRGYKVSDANRNRIIGVACRNLEELIAKGCTKLGIHEQCIRIQLQDGTFVDDEYFQSLPSQTLFIFLKPGESAITGADILYNALEALNLDYLRAGHAAQMFFTHNVKEKVVQLAKLIKKPEKLQNVELSKKSEDPEWFEGIDSRSVTKEEFMARRAQDRIRGYLYKTHDDLKKLEAYQNDKIFRKKLVDAIQEMTLQLKTHKYFGGYFDRSVASERLCDTTGNFQCRGRWDLSKCRYKGAMSNNHVINPYASRETRIVFSTWNFDHVVERSRTIIPAMIEAAKQASKNKCSINSNYFYRLLFTTDNLKLVHVVCHDKGAHSVQCDSLKFITAKVKRQ